MKVKNEKALHKLGLMVDLADPSKVLPLGKDGHAPPQQTGKSVTVTDFNDVPPPDESWQLDQLGDYARDQNNQIRLGERKLAIHAYRLGQALILAKKKLQHGDWGAFLKKHRISEPTWRRARQLVERASEADLLKVGGITKAYLKYDILHQPADSKDDEVHESDKPKKQRRTAKATGRKKGRKAKPSTPKDKTKRALHVFDEEADSPPSPEDPNSLLLVLTQMSSRLDLLAEEIKGIDWTKESRNDYRSILEDIIFTAQQIRQEVRT